MGFGNEPSLTQLKRDAARSKRQEARAKEAEAKLALVQRLIDRNRVAVPSNYLQLALGDRDRCPGCVSPYIGCPVHS